MAVLATLVATGSADSGGQDTKPAKQMVSDSGSAGDGTGPNNPRLSAAAAGNVLADHVKARFWCDDFAFTADSPKSQTCTVSGFLRGICNGAPATFERAWAPDAARPVFPARWDATNSRWIIEARCSTERPNARPLATVWLYEDRMELIGADAISVRMLR